MFKRISKPLEWEDVELGVWVHLDERTAHYLGSVFDNSFAVPPRVSEGFYKIVDIEENPSNRSSAPKVAQSKATLYLLHEDSFAIKTEPLPVVINPFCSIILSGAILLPDSLSKAVAGIQELIETNKNRHDCAYCGKKLNIVTMNVRICNSCEKTGEQESTLTQDDSSATLFMEDEDTIPF